LTEPRALLRIDDPPAGLPPGWYLFRRPRAVLRTDLPEEVPALLGRVEAEAGAGRWAVGLVAYEAAPGFDPALRTHPLPDGVPTAWFALFDRPEPAPEPAEDPAEADPGRGLVASPELVATIGDDDYRETIVAIRRAIARGDTYQANFTYRLRGRLPRWTGLGAAELFARLCRAQRAPYAAFLDLGEPSGAAVCSVSPELFFRREGGRVECRPMKGTAPRGRTPEEDRRAEETLRASPKERAENLMIVDMVRNDLGRVARPGSVRVPTLLDVERYDTVHQMTSTVTAESGASLPELFTALFPCASVTGAPKVSTMEILTGLESTPRGVYTGAVGWVAPGGAARFSVAIRTAWMSPHPAGGLALEYGTGGGVVWDSDPDGELAETRTKALALRRALDPEGGGPDPERDFELLETLLWTRAQGYALLERHLERLAASAERFGFPLDPEAALEALVRAASEALPDRLRVRLLCDRRGRVRVEAALARKERTRRTVRAALAPTPVDSSDPFLFHKTTRRGVYENALAEVRRAAGADDAILRNERGELTESTIANLVLDLDGELVTPPVACGLLPGTLRAELLARGRVRERVLVPADLHRAARVWLVSSVRGWRPVEVVPAAAVPETS
jgi:para-aminobenzoate synthetase / 4-amino-4-deoxychorismate lyase